jgi:hypothetical protein
MKISPHSWVGVERAGQYDLSVRLNSAGQFPDAWKDWHVAGLVADRFAPVGRVRLIYVDSARQYDNEVAIASHLKATNSALYYTDEYSELTAKVLSHGLENCNSLLTGWLSAEFGEREDLHARAILHLVDLLNGRGKSLASLPRIDAWRDLAQRAGDAVWRVRSRGKLP